MKLAVALALALAACTPVVADANRRLAQANPAAAAYSALAGAASPSTFLTTSIAYDTEAEATPCDTFDEANFGWSTLASAEEYGISANDTRPPPDVVQAVLEEICSAPQAAGAQLVTAVQAGGEEAQAWVYTLLVAAADCPDEQAAADAYQVAIDAVNSGAPADLPTVADWLANFAEASDAVGIPLCASLAVVEPDAGRLIEQRDFHTGGVGE